MPANQTEPLKAFCFLLLATICWGLSFLTMKALVLMQQKILPQSSTWFLTALSLIIRFGMAALILLFWNARTLRQITRAELLHGTVLGVVGGIGLLFQMDGVNYTSASTSAFLTQCYCLFIPLIVAVRQRRWPSKTLSASCALVLAGVAILSQFDFRQMRLGRGEWETLIATLFFTGQILWLERPGFAANNPNHITLIMFLWNALIVLPIPLLSFTHLAAALATYQSPAAILLMGILVFFCSLIAYSLMNSWQPHVEAAKAGVIYCFEPVFASLFALFLPQWISRFAKINYPNETLTLHLLGGGALIIAANILILFQAAQTQNNLRAQNTKNI